MTSVLLTIIGIFGLIKSAGYFVDQAIAIAKRFKISSFIVGFTVVAFGTSLPELVISLYSSYAGHSAIAITNVIGSNIANICVILGLLAVYRPYKLSRQDVFFNIPLNLFALICFIVIATLNNGVLTFISGVVLILFFIISIFLSTNRNHTVTIKTEVKINLIIFVLSLVGLIAFGKLSVDSVLELSKTFGIAESLFGYFVVAIGTSLPELIASFTAIKKGNSEIGIGNILGSNLFNLLFILGSASIINSLDLSFFVREFILLIIITISLVVLAFIGKKYYFTRQEGFVLLCFYVVFAVIQMGF